MSDVSTKYRPEVLRVLTDDELRGLYAEFHVENAKFNPHHDDQGRFAESDSVSSSSMSRIVKELVNRVTVDPETTNLDEAKRKIDTYLKDLPNDVVHEAASNIRTIEAYDNPEDAALRINELEYTGEDSRGAYDREKGRLITSLWISEDNDESGRNFYHELGHSLHSRILSTDWINSGADEWAGGLDEGFAEAFASWFTVNRHSTDPDAFSNSENAKDELKWFKRDRPYTYKLFKDRWQW